MMMTVNQCENVMGWKNTSRKLSGSLTDSFSQVEQRFISSQTDVTKTIDDQKKKQMRYLDQVDCNSARSGNFVSIFIPARLIRASYLHVACLVNAAISHHHRQVYIFSLQQPNGNPTVR